MMKKVSHFDVALAFMVLLLPSFMVLSRPSDDAGIHEYESLLLFLHDAENKDAVVIDLRSEDAFQSRHLQGAIHIDYQGIGFDDAVDTLAHDHNYLLYCNSGLLARRAARDLERHGIRHIGVLSHGLQGETTVALMHTSKDPLR